MQNTLLRVVSIRIQKNKRKKKEKKRNFSSIIEWWTKLTSAAIIKKNFRASLNTHFVEDKQQGNNVSLSQQANNKTPVLLPLL